MSRTLRTIGAKYNSTTHQQEMLVRAWKNFADVGIEFQLMAYYILKVLLIGILLRVKCYLMIMSLCAFKLTLIQLKSKYCLCDVNILPDLLARSIFASSR